MWLTVQIQLVKCEKVLVRNFSDSLQFLNSKRDSGGSRSVILSMDLQGA
jgi:hypothetical protein